MNNILERNMTVLKERMPSLYQACMEKIQASQDGAPDCVYTDRSARGENIIAVRKNGRAWYLNSRYDAQAAVEIWSEQCSTLHYKSIILLCGLANGAYLKKLQQLTGRENRILVYEPEEAVFLHLLHQFDLTAQLSDSRTGIFVEGLNMHCFRQYFREIYEFELVDLSVTLVSPGYGKLYAEPLEQLIAACQKEVRLIFGAKRTLENIGDEICDNIISNMWCLFKGSSVNALKAYFEEHKMPLEDIPAIIVSAGPSLDKNVETLKKAKGKAMVIAVDSAIRKLLQHDIIPDLIVTVDSHKPMELFIDSRVRDIPLAACGQSRHEILKNQSGKLFVFSGDMYLMKLFAFLGRAVQGMQTGGSVANDAFSLVEFLGFRNIILVGQDLAFTGHKKHASNVYEEKGIGESEEDEYTYVEGCDGSQLMTFTNFRIYKEWFEGRIADNPRLNVVNATEGGAKINGTVQMTLAAAIQKYCVREFYAACIQKTEPLFEAGQLEAAYEYLKAARRRCDELWKRFEQGKKQYERLGNLIRAGLSGGAEYQRIYEDISEISSLDKREPLMELLTMYAKKEESAILGTLYQEDDGVEGALSVVRHGTQILAVYQKKLKHIAAQMDFLMDYEVTAECFSVETYDISFV